MKIITVTNQKGGVGKTTTTKTLAIGLIEKGYKVLTVDMDPQASLTVAYGLSLQNRNIYNALKRECKLKDVITNTELGDIVSSSLGLTKFDEDTREIGIVFRLKEIIEESNLKDIYDYVLIDTPPSIGIITQNALVASNTLIIPFKADVFSAQGLNSLIKIISSTKNYFNKDLEIGGCLLTMYNSRYKHDNTLKDIIGEMVEKANIKMFDTIISSSVAISETNTYCANPWEYKPENKVIKQYKDLIEELLNKEIL